MCWDLGSGKKPIRIPDLGPGVKKTPDPNPQHWKYGSHKIENSLSFCVFTNVGRKKRQYTECFIFYDVH